MFIDARSRKVAIVLSAVTGGPLVMSVPKYEKNRLWRDGSLKLIDVSAQENCIIVAIETKYRVSIPLDMIEAAWLDGGRAHIAVSGYIEQYDTASREGEPKEAGGYFFMPLPRFMSIDSLAD